MSSRVSAHIEDKVDAKESFDVEAYSSRWENLWAAGLQKGQVIISTVCLPVLTYQNYTVCLPVLCRLLNSSMLGYWMISDTVRY